MRSIWKGEVSFGLVNVPVEDIAKAYESEDGEMVILTKEDLASLPVSSPTRSK
jgi:DNA end-binding protein Ku